MGELRSLLDVAAAVADGAPVDWTAAESLAVTPADRTLLAELRFIAQVAGGSRSGSSEPVPSQPVTPVGPLQQGDSGHHWGPLTVIEHVAGGTFGDIYRAWDSRLDREVALKVLRRRDDEDAQMSTAIQEARLLARVRHPNVATVYGAERIDGRVGMWMEFIHGKTLEAELQQNGPLPVERATVIGIELANALATVHRAGVIHRDVKAQNVMVDVEGRLVLTDFGAGVDLEEASEEIRELTGTPLCVAPEVLAGHPATSQSDIYGLGVLLYHLLTGTYPVRGRSLKEVRQAHLSGRRVMLAEARPDLPERLATAIDKALDPDPQCRYHTADAFAAALAALTEERHGEHPARTTRTRARLAAVAGVVLLVVSVATFAVWGRAATSRPSSPSALSRDPTVAIIEFPDSTRTDALGVNDEGVIVGSYVDAAKATRGFVSIDRRFTTIDAPGATRTRPTGLNNDGAITGDFTDAAGVVRGFLLKAGTFTLLDAPGATSTRAGSINRTGDIVGDYLDANGVAHGFLLRQGAFSTIDIPGAKRTRAIKVNDAGQIVGDYMDLKGVQHGFLYSKGQFTTIDVPAADVTQAFGISGNGSVVGGYGMPSRQGFLFNHGRFTPIDVPGAFRTSAHAINAQGVIVGSFLGGTPFRTRGFVLTP